MVSTAGCRRVDPSPGSRHFVVYWRNMVWTVWSPYDFKLLVRNLLVELCGTNTATQVRVLSIPWREVLLCMATQLTVVR